MTNKEIFVLTAIKIENEPGKQTLTYDPGEFYDIVEHHPDAYIRAVDSAGEQLGPLMPVKPVWEALYSETAQMGHRS